MRAALRLCASVQRSTQFLEAGAPTGLTGLFTHASPRSTLLYLYNDTLEQLKQFPEHSVYRQSTEALTKHRMSIIESVEPSGLEEWKQRVTPLVDSFPDAFRKIPLQSKSGDDYNIVWKEQISQDKSNPDDNHEYKGRAPLEGPRSIEARANQGQALADDPINAASLIPNIEGEPALTAEQVNDIEARIGAGLIEEVIQVAEGERHLVGVMRENNVWEDLEDKPQPGQWVYHERDTHTGKTQEP